MSLFCELEAMGHKAIGGDIYTARLVSAMLSAIHQDPLAQIPSPVALPLVLHDRSWPFHECLAVSLVSACLGQRCAVGVEMAQHWLLLCRDGYPGTESASTPANPIAAGCTPGSAVSGRTQSLPWTGLQTSHVAANDGCFPPGVCRHCHTSCWAEVAYGEKAHMSRAGQWATSDSNE